MDNFDRDLEDLLNMSDTDDDDDSSNSSKPEGMFENKGPVVLELHEIKKDEPGTEAKMELVKKKKEKRKKKKHQQDENKEGASDTSSSLSDSVPTIPGEVTKEEFYDARESYHALPENQQASPTAALVLAQVRSHHEQDPKTVPERTTTSERPSATTPREPSTINKPVSNPP